MMNDLIDTHKSDQIDASAVHELHNLITTVEHFIDFEVVLAKSPKFSVYRPCLNKEPTRTLFLPSNFSMSFMVEI